MYTFKICGNDSQYINLNLAPGEKILCEPGALMSMDGNCQMETIFGNGGKGEGLFGKIMGSGKRMLSGESMALVQIFNPSSQKDTHVLLSAPC